MCWRGRYHCTLGRMNFFLFNRVWTFTGLQLYTVSPLLRPASNHKEFIVIAVGKQRRSRAFHRIAALNKGVEVVSRYDLSLLVVLVDVPRVIKSASENSACAAPCAYISPTSSQRGSPLISHNSRTNVYIYSFPQRQLNKLRTLHSAKSKDPKIAIK